MENRTKYLGHDFPRTMSEIIAPLARIVAFPQIIAKFWCKKEIITPGYYIRGNTSVCSMLDDAIYFCP